MLTVWVLAVGSQVVHAEDYADQWGLPIGAVAPVIEAPDHTGAVRTLESLSGERGLLLFLNRSADW